MNMPYFPYKLLGTVNCNVFVCTHTHITHTHTYRPRGTSGTTRLLERAIKGISSSGGGGRSKQPGAKALPDNTVSQRTREKG